MGPSTSPTGLTVTGAIRCEWSNCQPRPPSTSSPAMPAGGGAAICTSCPAVQESWVGPTIGADAPAAICGGIDCETWVAVRDHGPEALEVIAFIDPAADPARTRSGHGPTQDLRLSSISTMRACTTEICFSPPRPISTGSLPTTAQAYPCHAPGEGVPPPVADTDGRCCHGNGIDDHERCSAKCPPGMSQSLLGAWLPLRLHGTRHPHPRKCASLLPTNSALKNLGNPGMFQVAIDTRT